jgi:hypothetical protein
MTNTKPTTDELNSWQSKLEGELPEDLEHL